MLERIAAGAPASWCYAERWAERLHRWARRCSHLVAAPGGLGRAIDLLDVPRERIHPLPGGVDTNLFAPREIDRRAFWQRVLVENPRGWLPDAGPGSVPYALEDVARLARDPVLTYVGRFTAVKRLDLLIEAFGCAQRDARCPASLVLVGGHPGEWEGEHPAQIAERLGVERVFLAGWYTQPELPDFFAASDAVVLASEREQFGQVLVEGMSCGLPAIALRSLGPSSIVDDEKTAGSCHRTTPPRWRRRSPRRWTIAASGCDEAKRPGGPCASASPGPPSPRGWLRPWPRRPPPRDRCS